MDDSRRKRHGLNCTPWGLAGALASATLRVKAQDPGGGSFGTNAPSAEAHSFSLESTGARFGVPAGSSGGSFLEADAFVDWNLPWRWNLGANWRLATRLDLSTGWLGAGEAQGAILTLGPTLVVQPPSMALSFEGGFSPTLISRYEYGTKDLGTYYQFTSHAGLNWDLARHLRLSYRFQHMSNGGVDAHNPGLNLHLFGLSYVF